MKGRGKILIVDDNPLNLKLMSELLMYEGLDTLQACQAEEAMRLIEREKPQLILMDIALPGMDGISLTKILKTKPETRDITIVAVSAFAMNSDKERAAEAGCDGFITKPIDTRNFIQTLQKFLPDELSNTNCR